MRQEIIAILLKHVQSCLADDNIEFSPKVVLTIPDFSPQLHKRLILQAAEISGLDQVQLISHSTAAMIYYNFWNSKKDSNEKPTKENVLIFHMGAGSTSVTVYEKTGDKVELISAMGDPHFGGEQLTYELTEEYGKKKLKLGVENKKIWKEVIEVCEQGKKSLSDKNETTYVFKDCFNFLLSDIHNKNFSLKFELPDFRVKNFKISRKKLENICKSHFDKLESLLIEAVPNNLSIEHVVLVGSSTRTPAVKNIISIHLPNAKIFHQILPEEAVVKGAAIKAALINENKELEIFDVNRVPFLPVWVKCGKVEIDMGEEMIKLPIVGKKKPSLKSFEDLDQEKIQANILFI